MRESTRNLSEEQVKHIAWLARIELSKEEVRLFTQQLNTIIEFFHVIDEVNVKNVQPSTHIVGSSNVMRTDRIEPSLQQDEALANAPQKEKGFFRAPRIV
ncbi:MAG: Asp-tRNA(Asn)/Glu-tRNA(Gln) amidotransferase subunit GatC [Candidatus Bathyarchaeota archaeon]|nr:MAG: Asp-tRNA(Asn)/Glu-tRNA(Gln) amidotransferase subunit GatC [Candidatus Bathyarchaeota archaeon]